MELYPWQEKDRAEAVDALNIFGGACLAWGMGSGKTITAVEIAKSVPHERVLIVAPLSTHPSWAKTAQGQGAPVVSKAGNGNKAEKEALFGLEFGVPGWYIVGPAFLTRANPAEWPEFDLVIVDEVHQITEKTSKGLKKLLTLDAPRRLALSGTPARNKVENLWGLNRFLYPELDSLSEVADSNFYSWAAYRLTKKLVYTSQRDRWGNPKTVTQYEGEKEPGSIFRDMPHVSVHLARERCCEAHSEGVLAALKEPSVMHETITLTPEQKKIIRDMETQMVTWLGENQMVTDIPLTAQLRIRQCILGVPTVTWYEEDGEEKQEVSFDPACKSPYLDRLIEILSQDEEPFVVWTASQKFAEVVTARLQKAGIPAEEYSGKRKADLNMFGTAYRVLVAIPAALGTGTDGVQSICQSEVWLDRDLDPTTNEQAEARLMRNGQKGQVRRWIFHDDIGLSEGRFSDAVMKRLELNRSLRLEHA